MTFYALGMNNLDGPGVYGDFTQADARLGRASFTKNDADNYKFKTPQLYNLVDSPFLGHGGNFRSVREIVEYKNVAIPQNAEVPTGQLAAQFVPLGLNSDEITDLVTFIEGGLYDPNLGRYVPASIPSGNCLIVNDAQSKADLNC
jgi:cytochrome c peroxidase